jgi:squalene-hopene/tetraprenyl-beta-curcumene cyclase
MQNADGGWSIVSGDPSAPDATGAVLDAFARSNFETLLPLCHRDRARDFLRRAQRADGSWDSATGVRFIHGTSSAVRGLLAVGVATDDDAVVAGVNWLVAHQHPTGGWGEAALSTANGHHDEFAAGPASASQTAWALLALVAAGQSSTGAVRRGVHFLLEAQGEDGSWCEKTFAHHDATSNCWFRSDLRSAADPLLALSRWCVAAAANLAGATERVPLRLVGATVGD